MVGLDLLVLKNTRSAGAMMGNWLVGQTALLTEKFEPHMNAGFQCSARSLHCPLSMMPLLDRLSSSSPSSIR